MRVRAGPRDRRADLADPGEAGAAERCAGREDVADPADPEQARALCAAGAGRGGPDRLHAGHRRRALKAAKQCRMGPYFIPAGARTTARPASRVPGTRRARAAA